VHLVNCFSLSIFEGACGYIGFHFGTTLVSSLFFLLIHSHQHLFLLPFLSFLNLIFLLILTSYSLSLLVTSAWQIFFTLFTHYFANVLSSLSNLVIEALVFFWFWIGSFINCCKLSSSLLTFSYNELCCWCPWFHV